MKDQEQKNSNNNSKEEKDLTNPNHSTSIIDSWQQYSPMVWVEMYNEYMKYTTSMTKVYKEYIKSSEKMTDLYKELATNTEKMTDLYKESVTSTERMTKYWLNKFRNPLTKEQEAKDTQQTKR